ncbi:hypothetical protein [Hymenobacter cavernae]|uniref:Prolyl-tRNA synthetase n=1 Tax=Hymenobacter cavernae TaxID=2044852 RepID=A0ABQ1TW30_9BACT|nr:hypothetical protein [Hymenobacter cavernae]GGF04505.1 hypothetical protein GCM10011383_14510 [Hymenobacter cavernae]
MKNKLTTLVPAVALLALSSCASTSGLTSTESDGVYYSSKDRTMQTATASTATDESQYQGIDEDTNPEYSSNAKSGSASGSNSEYYDDSYASRLGRFNNSSYSGLSYYSPVYTDPYFMGGSAFAPYYGLGAGYGSFYDPFYSSFYSPFGYGLGRSYMSLSLGFGSPWAYRPYGLGYGGFYDGFYNPYYGGGLYGGGYGLGYGYGGYGYGSSYYGGGYYGGNGDYGRSAVRYAPRRDRSREAITASQPVGNSRGGRIVGSGNMVDPNTGSRVAPTTVVGNATTNPASATGRGRGRILDNGASQPTGGFTSPNNNYNLSERAMSDGEMRAREGRAGRRMTDAGVSGNTNPATQSMEQPRIDYSGRGRRSQMTDNSSTGGSASPQDYQQPQRRSRFSEAFRNDGGGSNQTATPQRSYESRTFSQPSRSFSEPSPSRSSNFGGGNGGGNFGGGGGSSSGGGGGGGGRGRIR